MEDTIAAIATAYGEGGIGIVRISGPASKEILSKIFVSPKSKNLTSRQLKYGHIIDPDSKKTIDEVMAVYMKGPSTYTAEDVVEINCHGSVVSLQKTLEVVLRQGARIAEAGEFTKRAFLNGRLDLSQAEAVIDVVKAKTEKGFDVALNQMEGSLSERIHTIRESLLDLLVQTTVNIDYPDEDIEEITYDLFKDKISSINDDICNLLDTADTGKIIQEGLAVAIVGKPNVGKSSLMNALLKENRAIVTEIPGTTRDTIEEFVSLKSVPIRLIDTAGIRETRDEIERIGIEKSKEVFNKADLIILMLDGTNPLSEEDLKIIEYIKERRSIVLINKMDLESLLTIKDVKKHLPGATVIKTAIKKGLGLGDLEDEILNMVYGGAVKQNESLLITNIRHKELLEKSKQALDDAIEMTSRLEALDFIEVDIKNAYEFLGEIIGETVSDDIINAVFSRFCLGK